MIDKKNKLCMRRHARPSSNVPISAAAASSKSPAPGVVASYLPINPDRAKACSVQTSSPVTTQNKAKNVIFILLAGAPSHVDTFDLKVLNGTTPSKFAPDTVNGTAWPVGLLPQMATQLNNMVLVRSMQAHALVHSLAQTWTQIGRNPPPRWATSRPTSAACARWNSIPSASPGRSSPLSSR